MAKSVKPQTSRGDVNLTKEIYQSVIAKKKYSLQIQGKVKDHGSSRQRNKKAIDYSTYTSGGVTPTVNFDSLTHDEFSAKSRLAPQSRFLNTSSNINFDEDGGGEPRTTGRHRQINH